MGKVKKINSQNIEQILKPKISERLKPKSKKELKTKVKKSNVSCIFDQSLIEKIKYPKIIKSKDKDKSNVKKMEIKQKKLETVIPQITATTENEWNVFEIDTSSSNKEIEFNGKSNKKSEINTIIGDLSDEVQSENEDDHIENVFRQNYVSVLQPTINFVKWNKSENEESTNNRKTNQTEKIKDTTNKKKRKLKKVKSKSSNKKQNINKNPKNFVSICETSESSSSKTNKKYKNNNPKNNTIDEPEFVSETSESINTKLKQLAIDTEINEKSEDNCQYYVLNDACVVILKHPTKLYFNGVLEASALMGKVEVLGYVLTRKPQLVYSLRGTSFLCFETLDSSSFSDVNTLKLDKDFLLTLGLNTSVVDSLNASDCVLKFECYHGHKITFINHYIQQNIIPDLRDVNEMEYILKCRFAKDDTASLYNKSYEWDSILQSINQNPHNSKIVICGGKSVGKSTLFRYIINQLLSNTTAVLAIDLDIGQSEFFVPGCVSIVKVTEPFLGPNFTHLQKPDRSYLVGSVNATTCLNRYFKSVESLIEYCCKNESINCIPWVVNTMGFVRGLGNDIMTIVLRMLQPTHVIQINSENMNNNYEQFMEPNYISTAKLSFNWKSAKEYNNLIYNYDFFPINSVAFSLPSKKDTGWKLHPRELRNMNVYSYLSDMVEHKDQSLLEVKPYIINLNNLKLVSLNFEVNETLLPCVFNGNLVALCSDENCETDHKTVKEDIENLIYNNTLYRCIGFGIVRGIDKNDIYILTPLSLDDLNNVTCLVTAAEPLPVGIYLKTECTDCSIPYITTSSQIRTTLIPKKTIFNINKVRLLQKMNKT